MGTLNSAATGDFVSPLGEDRTGLHETTLKHATG